MRKQKKLNKLLQNFYDDTLEDPGYLDIVAKLDGTKPIEDPANEEIMKEAFVYLDAACQKMLRERMKSKNGPKQINTEVLE